VSGKSRLNYVPGIDSCVICEGVRRPRRPATSARHARSARHAGGRAGTARQQSGPAACCGVTSRSPPDLSIRRSASRRGRARATEPRAAPHQAAPPGCRPDRPGQLAVAGDCGFPAPAGSVRRDPVQPGTQRRPSLERVIGPPGADQRLLHLVFGIVHRAEHPVAVSEQLRPQRISQEGEVLALALPLRYLRRDPGLPAGADSVRGSDRQQRVDDGLCSGTGHAGLRDLQGGRVFDDPIAARPAGRPRRPGACRADGSGGHRYDPVLRHPEGDPESVARAILDGVEKDEEDIFPDPMSESVAEGWRADVAKALERQFATFV
jgi:hypothetical protein